MPRESALNRFLREEREGKLREGEDIFHQITGRTAGQGTVDRIAETGQSSFSKVRRRRDDASSER